jgi:hypothetical protein
MKKKTYKRNKTNLPNRSTASLAFIHVAAVRVVQSLLFLDGDRNFGDYEWRCTRRKTQQSSSLSVPACWFCVFVSWVVAILLRLLSCVCAFSCSKLATGYFGFFQVLWKEMCKFFRDFIKRVAIRRGLSVCACAKLFTSCAFYINACAIVHFLLCAYSQA